MDTNNQNVGELVKKASEEKVIRKKVSLSCNVRLRPGLVALPNQLEEEFNYTIDSILAPSGGPLKGVTGPLERVLMPSIVDVSVNDNTFNSHIKEYWCNFSNNLPPDSSNKIDTTQGVVIKITAVLYTNLAIDSFEKAARIEDKFKVVHDLLETQAMNPSSTVHATLDADYYADFVKLAFILKHSKIANKVEDREKSSKIIGYIYEKAIAVAAKKNEMEEFNSFLDNLKDLKEENKANAILLAIDEAIADTDTLEDKKLIIFNKGKIDATTRSRVNKIFTDNNWLYKYYVNQGLQLQILKRPANSTIIQYADLVIGNDVATAALYLKDTSEGTALLEVIKSKLKSE